MRGIKLGFEIKALKAKIKTNFNRLYCWCDANKVTATYSPIIGHLFDTIIVALTAKNF